MANAPITILFDQFRGIAPRVDPHSLQDGYAQTAQNTKLVRGILQAWKDPAQVLGTTTGINTIRRYVVSGTENWLCWSGDVTSVESLHAGDTHQTVIWSDPSDGIPKISRNDKLVFTGNYVKDTAAYFRLGVPAPTDAPGMSVTGTEPSTAGTRTFVYAWAFRGKVGASSAEFSVEVAEGQKIVFNGLDTVAPVATSNWPNASPKRFRKWIFQRDSEADKYVLIGRVTDEAESFEYNGKKTIKAYTAKVFKPAAIDAPTSATAIISDYCSSVTGWTLGAGWTHGASSFTHAAGTASDLTRAVTGLTAATEYVIYLDTSGVSTGTFAIKLDSTTLQSGITANRMQIVRFTATATSHNVTISATSDCNVTVDNLFINGTEVEAVAKDDDKLDPGERRYAYCFTYQASDGSLKRGDLSAETVLSGIDDDQQVYLSGFSTSFVLPAGATGLRKRLFRRDLDANGTWRVVAAMDPGRKDWVVKTPKKKLGMALGNWALVASSTPATVTATEVNPALEELEKTSAVYLYTYVTEWGEESAPGPVSDLVEPHPYQEVTLTTGTTAPTNYGNVKFKRFYRTDSSGVFRVLFGNDVPIATASIVDDVDEDELGDPLITTDWDVPPGNSDTKLIGLCALPNGVLCGGWGKQVGFSEPGYPYAWPIANQFTLDYTFVGAAVTANGVLVCTTGTPYLCQGSDPASMVPQRIENQQGCLSATSIVDMGDYVIYASPDGLVGVSGTDVQVLTADILTRDQWQAYAFKTDGSISTLKASRYEGRYVITYTNSSTTGTLLFDPADKSLVTFTLAPTAMFSDVLTDSLYLQIDSNIQKFDAGSAYTYTWRSKRFLADGAFNLSAARVDASAYPVTFKLYADGVLKHTQTVASNRAFRLPAGYRGFSAEIELSGTADIRHVSVSTLLRAIG